jgi:hypothetical protein
VIQDKCGARSACCARARLSFDEAMNLLSGVRPACADIIDVAWPR